MKFTVTTLVENSVPLGMGRLGEHGLSFFIESDGRKILFDTGQGKALFNNAPLMEIDLQAVDTVVLSHGHYDHTGGLAGLADINNSFELVAHPDVFTEKLAMFPGPKMVPIGISISREALEEKGIKMKLESGPVEIAPGVTTTGEIPMNTDFEKIEPLLFVRKDGNDVPDPLADDLSLILKTEKGIVVVLGCTHRGIVNTLNHVKELTGEEKIHTIVGGLHLERAPDKQIEKTVETLRDFGVQKICPGHCTGMRAMVRLTNEFGDKVSSCSVGFVIKC